MYVSVHNSLAFEIYEGVNDVNVTDTCQKCQNDMSILTSIQEPVVAEFWPSGVASWLRHHIPRSYTRFCNDHYPVWVYNDIYPSASLYPPKNWMIFGKRIPYYVVSERYHTYDGHLNNVRLVVDSHVSV